METGIFAAGCFWKPDLEFEKLKGIKKKIGIIPKKNRMNKTCPNGTSFKYLTIKSILLKQITDPTMYKTAF